MAKKKGKSEALVHTPDAQRFADDLEDLESMSQKAVSAELKAKKAHDFIRRYRRWRNGMLKMEQDFWAEAATLVDEPVASPEAEVTEPDEGA